MTTRRADQAGDDPAESKDWNDHKPDQQAHDDPGESEDWEEEKEKKG